MILEFRKVRRQRIVDLNLAFLGQHHERHGCDRLGHGSDAEDRIALHRNALLAILETERLEIGDLAVAGDQYDSPWNRTLVDIRLKCAAEPFESCRRKAECFRLHRLRQAFRQGRKRQTRGDEQNTDQPARTHLTPPWSKSFGPAYHGLGTPNHWQIQSKSRAT